MPLLIRNIIESNWLWITARFLLAFLFLSSGLGKLLVPETTLKELEVLGLEPAWLFNYASALVLVIGASCIIFNKYLWLGAGAVSVFLVLAIFIAHAFWNMKGVEAQETMYLVIEHIAVIGGLISASIAGHYRQYSQELNLEKKY